jgi:hypothetical protein
MKVEWWGSGVDFYVVTPFYVVSNLYKRKSGTLIAPMPIELVKGTFAQLGKPYIFQVKHFTYFVNFLFHLLFFFFAFCSLGSWLLVSWFVTIPRSYLLGYCGKKSSNDD